MATNVVYFPLIYSIRFFRALIILDSWDLLAIASSAPRLRLWLAWAANETKISISAIIRLKRKQSVFETTIGLGKNRKTSLCGTGNHGTDNDRENVPSLNHQSMFHSVHSQSAVQLLISASKSGFMQYKYLNFFGRKGQQKQHSWAVRNRTMLLIYYDLHATPEVYSADAQGSKFGK